MFTELVLLFGLALNVFGNMCIHSIAEAYISYKRRYNTTPTGIDHHHHHVSNNDNNNNEDTMDGEWNENNSTSQYHSGGGGSGGSDQFVIKRQNQLFYPDLPSRDRFRTYLIALVCQIIYYVILNCLIFMIAKLVTAAYLNSINHKNDNNNNGANDNYKSNGTIMNWLWVLGAGVGFITIMFDAGSLIRTYVAFVMLKQEDQMRKQAHSNLELVSTAASDVNNNHSNDPSPMLRHHGGNDYYNDDDGMVDGYLDTSQVIMPEPSVATMRTTNQPKTTTKQINDDVPTYTIAAAATEPSVPMFSLIGDDEEPF